jgi:amino acid transporter
MKSLGKAILYGLLVWLIPFAVSILIFPIHDSNRPLFESIMPVVVTLSVVFFLVLYFKKLDKDFLKEGIWLGIIWLIISIVIDLLMFMWGPMKTSFVNYMADIGLTYLIMPIITIGVGFLVEKRRG